ncbi:disease resistance protein RPV1-like [Hevea brasiliensis]|uniref:disease resistance protein RPV1-like n=1 Tax=Hevea brasiliensis TaxID=3981 RepID=UPI0025D35745|nr:disease resistance protein RPV1-like [Hevea brasiliensis]
MASASSSTRPCKYDVFISFRGKDVRLGFLSHLCTALQQKQINAFLDEELHKGEEISSALLKIIEESIVSIVIFSENYADSPWCLDELVKILECKETLGQLVLPVFYHVDPTDVQDLTGNFGKSFALAKRGEQVKGCSHKWKHALTEVLRVNFQQAFAIVVHGEHVQDCVPKVDRWKRALMEVSKVAGWDSRNIMHEAKLVEEIVNDVLKKFSGMSSSDDSYNRNLVGIESRVKKVEQLLNDNKVVGIWGMPGIGKTTIAQVVFRRNKIKFDGHCFLDKVRETTTLLREKKLLEDTLFWGPFIRSRLGMKKIFIVFDDVDDADHLKDLLKKLIGEYDLHRVGGVGSRIVITSRDQQVLENFCPKECIYKVEKLTYSEDLKLFSLHAFKQNHPNEGYMELSQKAITYAGGNPLALKVLGSHLFGMGIEEWKGELKKLNGQSLKKIQDVLKISYDGLERDEKEIFLDIACFFNLKRRDRLERILEACGFHPKGAIHRLIKKSLISISRERIEVHDLLRQMGKDIIIEECKQPGGRSRLWNYEDIDHVFTTNTGTESVEAIVLDVYSTIDDLKLSPTAFTKMCKLRMLIVRSSEYLKGQVLLPNNLEFLPQELRYLEWDYYPLTSLPSNFCPKNLVELHMTGSKLRQLWHGDKHFENLISLELFGSKDLIRIPDLSNTAPNLEVLDLSGCRSLTEIPSLQNLSKLTKLQLDGCHKVTCCPEIPCSIRFLNLGGTGIEQLPSSIEHRTQLEDLSLRGCKRLVSIPSGISELKCLITLDLLRCSNLTSLPESIKQVSKLESLDLSGCERLERLPDLPSSLKELRASECTSLKSASTSFLFEDHARGFLKSKLLQFDNCFNLEDKKKVIEDVIETHLLGQDVGLFMVGGEVPEWMRYKNKIGSSLSFELDLRHLIAFSFCAIVHPKNDIQQSFTCRVDFIDESGHRHRYDFSHRYLLSTINSLHRFDFSSEHMSLWLDNKKFESVDEKCIVEASFHYGEYRVKIIKCGIHPIYSRKRSRNEEHQDDEEHQPAFQRLEEEKDNNIKRRRINYKEEEKEEEACNQTLLTSPAGSLLRSLSLPSALHFPISASLSATTMSLQLILVVVALAIVASLVGTGCTGRFSDLMWRGLG